LKIFPPKWHCRDTPPFCFQGEESNSSANKCLLKVAHYSAQLENYERAIQIYEQVPFPVPSMTGFP
jgi:hypothetical protein